MMRSLLRALLAGIINLALALGCTAAQDLGGDGPAPPAVIPDDASAPLPGESRPPRPDATDGGSTLIPSVSPRRISGGQDFSCAITTAGAARCWGQNYWGQLGNGKNRYNSSMTPVGVVGLAEGVVGITARHRHACAVTSTGAASCWGQLGSGETSIPEAVVGLGSGVVAVVAGRYHSCALRQDGPVICWGGNRSGEIGAGEANYRDNPPTEVTSIAGAVAIAAGASHTCAIVGGGAVSCWGANGSGQLGNGTTDDSAVPVAVTGVIGAIDLTSTDNSTCALDATGAIRCWGVLQATIAPTWTPMGLASLVPGGACHACGITKAGALRCWGCNSSGQLGDGTMTGRGPSGPSGFNVVAAGSADRHTCAITTGGIAKCWGLSLQFEGSDSSPSPRDVVGW